CVRDEYGSGFSNW
nr:immunoglobulin heavy chain junction region [Macaca mulatta]MOV38451.1 immunoglobulin heavy chain junction region [Macaca mulatta]MOV38537.1 immunoglobulin heavy chain junction region [Macaca mulatta]MOV38611.1 immunoglobulin heavy chain junction region [Macaca mulatta]MOV38826.1 immunoglobulin heavy chain junction region [Macaca mulatta]